MKITMRQKKIINKIWLCFRQHLFLAFSNWVNKATFFVKINNIKNIFSFINSIWKIFENTQNIPSLHLGSNRTPTVFRIRDQKFFLQPCGTVLDSPCQKIKLISVGRSQFKLLSQEVPVTPQKLLNIIIINNKEY